MNDITLLYASRNRPHLVRPLLDEWVGNCKNSSRIELLLGLDDDDKMVPQYVDAMEQRTSKFGLERVIVANTRNTVQVFNHLASCSTTESKLLVCLSDDVFPCPKWDDELLRVVSHIDCLKDERGIGVDDGIHGMDFLPIVIVTRGYFVQNGYVLYPEYRSCRADDDFTLYVHLKGILILAPHIVFPHRHWSLVHGTPDETSSRIMGKEEMEYGWSVFQRRNAMNFGVMK